MTETYGLNGAFYSDVKKILVETKASFETCQKMANLFLILDPEFDRVKFMEGVE